MENMAQEMLYKILYLLFKFLDNYWVFLINALFAIMVLLAPYGYRLKQGSIRKIYLSKARRVLVFSFFLLVLVPVFTHFLYIGPLGQYSTKNVDLVKNWALKEVKRFFYLPILGIIIPCAINWAFMRYASTFFSQTFRMFRKKQATESVSDVREEAERYQAIDFNPQDFYKEGYIFVGMDEEKKPIYIPEDIWKQTNAQVIGPTRYGKGVLLGNLMDQIIRNDDCLFYTDPKDDQWAPHVMYQACLATNRKFYYITLHDEGVGSWAPFEGGSERDGLTRLENAFGLEFTGNPGSDYYKAIERKGLVSSFKKARGLKELLRLTIKARGEGEEENEGRMGAELERWGQIKSLQPDSGQGFSIEKAIKENAVVYVQGHLRDSVVKAATTVFIVELIQEATRLKKERRTHLTAIIDEVSFLVSKELAGALATTLGAGINFVLAYQSQNDLLNLENVNLNGKYISNSINVNSQIKIVYGGSDYELASWVSNRTGTIPKEVSKTEKTDTNIAGGEEWESERTVGTHEENYITTNKILQLPPRVCVFFMPRSLAKINFTSFVQVKDINKLEAFLEECRIKESVSKRNSYSSSREEKDNAKTSNGALHSSNNHKDTKDLAKSLAGLGE